jgi:hypothetical protein
MKSLLKSIAGIATLILSGTVSALTDAPYVPNSNFDFVRYLADVKISDDIVHCARLAIVERDSEATQHLRNIARGFERREYFKKISDDPALNFDSSTNNLAAMCNNASMEMFKSQQRLDASEERVNAVKLISDAYYGCDTVNAQYRSGVRKYRKEINSDTGVMEIVPFLGWDATRLQSVLQGHYDSLPCDNSLVIRHHRRYLPFAEQHNCPKCDNGDGIYDYKYCP